MREKINLLFAVVLTFFLSISHAFEISNHFQLHISYGFIVILTLVCVAYIFALKTLKGKTVYHVMILASGSLLLLGGGLFLIRVSKEIGTIIAWLKTYNGVLSEYQPFYAYTVIVLLIVLITSLIFLMVSNQILSNVLALFYLVGMVLAAIFGVHLNRFSEIVLISYLVTSIAYLGGYFIHKTKHVVEHESAKAFLLPVGIFFALVLALLPSKDTPMEWKILKKMVTSTVEYVQDLAIEFSWKQYGEDGLFSIAMSGYSDSNDELGGDISEDKRTVILVSADAEDAKYPLYFVGSINDHYTGSRWEKAEAEEASIVPEYFLNYLESYIAFGTISDASNQILRSQNINITYADMKTRTLFYPDGTRRIKLFSENKLSHPYDTNLLFEKIAKQGTAYQIQCISLNVNQEEVQQKLIAMENFSYDMVATTEFEDILKEEKRFYPFSIANEMHDLNGNGLKSLLMRRASDIYENYTALPDIVPERVYALADEITRDYSTKYEKLKAIEAYVSSYKYSKESAKVGDNEDFVDQFLFEEKEGYCTSFASAMAVLARCVDIPTRYVEGYLCTYKNKSEGVYIVSNTDAHAWVEAYFEGVGWIAFEPTSGYETNRYQVWEEKKKEPESSPVTEADLEKYRHQFSQSNVQQGQQTQLDKKENMSVAFWFLFGCISIGILLIALLFLITRVRFLYKYKRFSNEEKAEYLYMRILQYFKRKGILRQQNETLSSFVQKVKEAGSEHSAEFEALTNLYMRFCYGGQKVTDGELEQFSKFGLKMAASCHHRSERLAKLIDDVSFMMHV